jgi:NADH-quinone oxidoreductase subunit I
MPIAEKDIKWLEEPKIGMLEQLYLPAIFAGLQTTVKHLFQPKVTTQFPEERPTLPPNYRGVHRLNRDEQGRVRCVACYMCATACPAHCIDIVAAASPWPDREKYPETFVIDELRCIYCGMCEEACPVDAIELTSLYDLTGLGGSLSSPPPSATLPSYLGNGPGEFGPRSCRDLLDWRRTYQP